MTSITLLFWFRVAVFLLTCSKGKSKLKFFSFEIIASNNFFTKSSRFYVNGSGKEFKRITGENISHSGIRKLIFL